MLPLFIQNHIQECLAEVHHSQDLRLIQRIAFYKMFEHNQDNTAAPATFASRDEWVSSRSHRRYVYLAIVSVRHVLPVWYESLKYTYECYPDFADADYPSRLLDLAQARMDGAADPDYIAEVADEAYHFVGNSPLCAKYEAACVLDAAHRTFATAGGGWFFPFDEKHSQIDPDLSDRDLWEQDIAFDCAQAASAIDHDAVNARERTPVTYDYTRRRRFWEWWLMSAIPQTWMAIH